MTSWQASLAFLAIVFVLLVVFFLVTLQKEKGRRRDESIVQKYFGKRINQHRVNVLYQRSYLQFQRIPGLRTYVFKIRKRLELLHAFDEYSLRRQAMQITFATLGISCLLVIALLFLYQSLFMLLSVLMGILVLNGMLIDTFVNRVEDKLFKKAVIFFEDNRNFYQETRNIETSLYQSIEIAPPAIDRQAKRIYDVLTSKDSQLEMDKYYDVAPNRFLKLFASYAFLVFEYGDRIVEKKSLYLHALAELIRDTNMEIMRRDKLTYRLKGLTTIAVVPILFIGVLESWATSKFPIMADYYNSRMGFVSLISIFLIVLCAYVGLRKMLDNDESRYVAKSKKIQWEKHVANLPLIKTIVQRLTPKKHKRQHFQLTKLIRDANSPLLLEWLTVRRLLLSCLTFVLGVSIFWYLHVLTVNNALHNPFFGSGFFGNITAEQEQRMIEQTEFDRQILQEIKQSQEQVTPETIIAKLEETSEGNQSQLSLMINAERILEKYNILKTEYFKWWELLVTLVLTYLAYQAPVMVLWIQKKIRETEMQTEVDQLHNIISVLAEFERIDVEVILEWMERFSIIFQDPIKKCLNAYSAGQYEALDQLEQDVSFEPFRRIVQKLKHAVEKISVKNAFDDLEMTKQQNAQQREERFNRSIEQKSSWGLLLGFAPMGYIVLIYLVLPMLYLSSVQMSSSMQNLQGL